MSKQSSFYVIWYPSDNRSTGQNFVIVSKTELYAYLRSGRVFFQIKPFYFSNPGEVFDEFITSYKKENDND